MTPATVELTAHARDVAERATQPGTEEARAAQELLGINPQTAAEPLTPTDLIEGFANLIEKRAQHIGYQKAAQERTAEDRAFSRAARRRSAQVVRTRVAEGC